MAFFTAAPRRVKPSRVSPARSHFGVGILDEPKPIKVEAVRKPTHETVSELVALGLASRRPTTDGYGVSSFEWLTLNRHVNEARRKVESSHFGDDNELGRKVGDATRAAARQALREITSARPVLEPIAIEQPEREGVQIGMGLSLAEAHKIGDAERAARKATKGQTHDQVMTAVDEAVKVARHEIILARGFRDRKTGVYVPSRDEESRYLLETLTEEAEALDAHHERMAWRAMESDYASGLAGSYDYMATIGACG